MKKIHFILMSIIVTTVGCGDEDYSIEYIDTENKTEIVATLEVSRQKAVAGTYIDFSASIPESISSKSVMTVRATNKNNGDYTIIKDTLEAGATVMTSKIKMPSNSINPDQYEGLNTTEIKVFGLELVGEINDPYIATSNSVDVVLLDPTGWDAPYPIDYCSASADPQTPGLCDDVVEPWLVYNIDWEGAPNNDLDIYMYGEDGLRYEYSWSGDRFEGDYFNGNWVADQVYDLDIDVYTGSNVNTRITIYDHLGNVYQNEGVMDGYSTVAKITKSGGTTNDITYSIEWLID
jgi:hypothetical protein